MFLFFISYFKIGDDMQMVDGLGIIGGLSLLLYGIHVMSEGLESIVSHQLEKVLYQLTNKKWKAICVGIVITALIHSSSAMTVILIGLLNANMIPLKNALWVVLGANIGTTITGQLLAFEIGTYAPIIAFIGVIIFMCIHQKIGHIIIGIGLLFMGLEMMSLSLLPLQNSSFFLYFTKLLTHPIMGILVGTLFTAVIQSSSASIGILQSLAKVHLLTFQQATYIIFGFDIGTCITAFIASISSNHLAKQLALFHLLLNVVGTLLFVGICFFTPFISWVEMLTPSYIAVQIANMHTLFNIGTTLFALCIEKKLIRIIKKF